MGFPLLEKILQLRGMLEFLPEDDPFFFLAVDTFEKRKEQEENQESENEAVRDLDTELFVIKEMAKEIHAEYAEKCKVIGEDEIALLPYIMYVIDTTSKEMGTDEIIEKSLKLRKELTGTYFSTRW